MTQLTCVGINLSDLFMSANGDSSLLTEIGDAAELVDVEDSDPEDDQDRDEVPCYSG